MQIVSGGDNLHEMSNPAFWGKKEKYIRTAEIFTQRAKLWVSGYMSFRSNRYNYCSSSVIDPSM